jgi:hypothetical protein
MELTLRIAHGGACIITTREGQAPHLDITTAAELAARQASPQLAKPAVAAATGARFVDNGDGTVTDTSTDLMWSREDVVEKCTTHAKATKACGDLRLAGHADWRLPTRAELLTLVDDTRHAPAIDTEAFPSCKKDWYWASTPAAWSSDYAWIVNFGSGCASDGHRDGNDALARAVRSVPAGQ